MAATITATIQRMARHDNEEPGCDRDLSLPPQATPTHLCLVCKVPVFFFSSSSLLLASSSWVRGLGAGLGGMVGSWMKGCEGCTLFRSWALTQGCTAPGRSTELGRDTSWLDGVFLDPVVLLGDILVIVGPKCTHTTIIQIRVNSIDLHHCGCTLLIPYVGKTASGHP